MIVVGTKNSAMLNLNNVAYITKIHEGDKFCLRFYANRKYEKDITWGYYSTEKMSTEKMLNIAFDGLVKAIKNKKAIYIMPKEKAEEKNNE